MASQQITLQPTTVHLNLYGGDDVFLDVVATNTDGTPVDLTGAVAHAQVRAKASSPDVLATWDSSVDGSTVHLHLRAADASRIPLAAVWDVQVLTEDGVVITLVTGTMSMTREVTR